MSGNSKPRVLIVITPKISEYIFNKSLSNNNNNNNKTKTNQDLRDLMQLNIKLVYSQDFVDNEYSREEIMLLGHLLNY